MILQETSGSQTAVINTEHSLASVTFPARYRLRVDLNNLAGGATPDIVEIRIKVKTLTGSTVRQERLDTFTGGLLVDKVYESPEVWSPWTIEVSLKQTQGTGRVFDWSLMRDEDLPVGAVVADGGNSATTFKTDLASAVDDFYNGAYCLFTTGSLAGQVRKVSDYTGATKFVTLSPSATATPGSGDKFVLVNR